MSRISIVGTIQCWLDAVPRPALHRAWGCFKEPGLILNGKGLLPRATGSSKGPGVAEILAVSLQAYGEVAKTIRLNQVVELIGVLSRAPELAAPNLAPGDGSSGDDEMFQMLGAEQAARPPTSQVPRLHVILAAPQTTALPATGQLALCNPSLMSPAMLPLIRQRAVEILESAVGGDKLAAEYLLLQLLARVHTRTEADDTALGVLALNITACPEPSSSATPSLLQSTSQARPGAGMTSAEVAAAAAEGRVPPAWLPAGRDTSGAAEEGPEELPAGGVAAAVGAAMKALAARVLITPLSVALLNRVVTRPKRDAHSGRLIPGTLQLPPLTKLLVDECAMLPGALNSNGIVSLQALATLMRHQTVDYDFEVYMLPQPSDVTVTVFSSGQSLFKDSISMQLPLRPVTPLVDAAVITAAAEGEDLGPLRAYVATAQTGNFEIDDAASAMIEREVTRKLAEDRKTPLTTFHRWMTLARLMAVSHGEGLLSPERWASVMEMEQRRISRLPPPDEPRPLLITPQAAAAS